MSFTFWQVDSLCACEASPSCSDHSFRQWAVIVLPNHLRCTHAKCVAICQSFGAVAYTSSHFPANSPAISFQAFALTSLAVRSLSGFILLDVPLIVAPFVSIIANTMMLTGYVHKGIQDQSERYRFSASFAKKRSIEMYAFAVD